MTSLPPYSGEMVTCPKCEARGATTEWLPPDCSLSPYGQIQQHASMSGERHPGGWLLRRCTRCRYPWAEACTDEIPAVVPGQRISA